MEIPKLIILLCCTYSISSEHSSYTIPVEHYETELKDLGEHVDVHETPVKVIKITKTVAVKIPVPYPVKVVEKVPYPVHVSKPYPVPVPQIVHVPQPAHTKPLHEASAQSYGGASSGPYQVQEHEGDSFAPQAEHSFGGNSGYSPNFGSDEHHSLEGAHTYGSSGGSDHTGAFAGNNYEDSFKQYLHNNNGNSDGHDNFHYH